MLHIDDLERLQFLEDLLQRSNAPRLAEFAARQQRLLAMLHFSLWGLYEPRDRIDADLERVWMHRARVDELVDLLQTLKARLTRVTRPVYPHTSNPLQIHASYTLAELPAALASTIQVSARGTGVRWIEAEAADVFWFNLRKTEKYFSPTTM